MKKSLQLILNLEISNPEKINQKMLHDSARQLLRKEKIFGSVEIDLLIVGQKKMRFFNKKYLGQDTLTDVLSLPILKKKDWLQYKDSQILLGGIIISHPQAKKQAREKNITIDEEIKLLFEHGLKHLLGYHHG